MILDFEALGGERELLEVLEGYQFPLHNNALREVCGGGDMSLIGIPVTVALGR